jgi:hypothetical protein
MNTKKGRKKIFSSPLFCSYWIWDEENQGSGINIPGSTVQHWIFTIFFVSVCRTKSRKEKNKLASRACRLKKKAQHEANKLKLHGLEEEHSESYLSS